MTQLINQSINDDGVYRTAPATPGLLTIYIFLKQQEGNKSYFFFFNFAKK